MSIFPSAKAPLVRQPSYTYACDQSRVKDIFGKLKNAQLIDEPKCVNNKSSAADGAAVRGQRIHSCGRLHMPLWLSSPPHLPRFSASLCSVV